MVTQQTPSLRVPWNFSLSISMPGMASGTAKSRNRR